MEFHELGKQCAFPACNQLDFLPFLCPSCGLVFCKNHYLPEHHVCIAHSNRNIIPPPVQVSSQYFTCTHKDCNVSSTVPLLCTVCQHHYCISHRHHGCLDKPPTEEDIERWKKPREQFNIAKSEVDRQVSSTLKEQAKKKGNPTALKVQLMRLKGRAKGPPNVPVQERSYFLVHPPLQCTLHSQAAYICHQWVLGRVIDSLAETCKIPNRNNEAMAPKLRLFRHMSGEMLNPISKTLQTLLSDGEVCDGESLVLEYVPGDNVGEDCLINTSLYKE